MVEELEIVRGNGVTQGVAELELSRIRSLTRADYIQTRIVCDDTVQLQHSQYLRIVLLRIGNLSAFGTFAKTWVIVPVVDEWFQLYAQVSTVKGVFTDDGGLGMRVRLAVPPETI